MTDINAIIQKVKQKKEEEKLKKEEEKKATETPKVEDVKVESIPVVAIETNKPIPVNEILKDDGVYRNELLAQMVILNKTMEDIRDGIAFFISKD